MSPSNAPRPFRIAIPQRDLDDLKTRLARTRFPDAAQNAGWGMGTDLTCETWWGTGSSTTGASTRPP